MNSDDGRRRPHSLGTRPRPTPSYRYVFGFGGYWVSQRTSGVLKLANASGLHSARTFAVLGGLYAGVSCFMQRLRQKSDAVNAGVSGCSTGLVLGWGTGGWIGGLQSCVLFGAFSYFLDGTSLGGSAEAAEGGRCRRRVGVMGTTGKERGRRGREGELGTSTTTTATAAVTAASGGSERIRSVLLPALPLLRGDYFR